MAIDERTFINKKRIGWERLSIIVETTKNGGLKRLSRDELTAFGSLYRRTAADLSYARAQGANPNLVLYLNELVGNAHGVIYTDESGSRGLKIKEFFIEELPEILRRRMPFIVTAALLTLIGGILAYVVVLHDENMRSLFLPAEFNDSAEAWKQGEANHGDVSASMGTLTAAFLMTHNTQIGIIAFATGITVVIPVFLMLYNGFTVGAIAGYVQPYHQLPTLWAGILPHGVCELSAIFICGGAGMCVGWALIAPGKYSRKDALIFAGIDACKMMIATVPLFIVAGIIEGNISHSSIPHWVKFTFAGVQAAALTFYVYGPGETVKGTRSPVRVVERISEKFQ